MTRLFQRWLASALLSISMVATTVGASYGQDKVVRIGFQKYGKLVLLKHWKRSKTAGSRW
jgi:sulfonate transport system substrate-binding protein